MSIGISKKSYQPKPDKLIKLSKYYAEIKNQKGKNCDLFTKTGKLILIMILLQGCSAQWHLKQAIKKDPSILIQGKQIQIDTIVLRDSVRFEDTLIIQRIDTSIIEKDRIRIEIIRKNDTFKIRTLIKPDTIRITKTIALPPQIIYRKEAEGYIWKVISGIIASLLFAMFLGLIFKRNEK